MNASLLLLFTLVLLVPSTLVTTKSLYTRLRSEQSSESQSDITLFSSPWLTASFSTITP